MLSVGGAGKSSTGVPARPGAAQLTELGLIRWRAALLTTILDSQCSNTPARLYLDNTVIQIGDGLCARVYIYYLFSFRNI